MAWPSGELLQDELHTAPRWPDCVEVDLELVLPLLPRSEWKSGRKGLDLVVPWVEDLAITLLACKPEECRAAV